MAGSKKFTPIPKEVREMPRWLKIWDLKLWNIRCKSRIIRDKWKHIPYSVYIWFGCNDLLSVHTSWSESSYIVWGLVTV